MTTENSGTTKQDVAARQAGLPPRSLSAARYAEGLSIQLRKGFMAYCVLLICSMRPHYTGDIIRSLSRAEMVAVEGTIYPLLNKLQRDGLLTYQWRESDQGPPRKYYQSTEIGQMVADELKKHMKRLSTTLKLLEKGVTA